MPRRCSVCIHPKHDEINQALLDGVPKRNIATRYGLSQQALIRHVRNHLPKALVKAHEAKEVTQSNELLRRAKAYEGKAVQLLKKAEEARDFGTALRGVREARGCLELLAKMRGELEQGGTTINIISNPQWIELKTVILSALKPYPEAKTAVRKAIADGHGG